MLRKPRPFFFSLKMTKEIKPDLSLPNSQRIEKDNLKLKMSQITKKNNKKEKKKKKKYHLRLALLLICSLLWYSLTLLFVPNCSVIQFKCGVIIIQWGKSRGTLQVLLLVLLSYFSYSQVLCLYLSAPAVSCFFPNVLSLNANKIGTSRSIRPNRLRLCVRRGPEIRHRRYRSSQQIYTRAICCKVIQWFIPIQCTYWISTDRE